MKDELLKYSQQIIAYDSASEYYIANGFFVLYKDSYYFITAEHAIFYEYELLSNVYFVLHENGNNLNTYVKKFDKWQVVKLYLMPDDVSGFTFPIQIGSEDFAFCRIEKNEETIELPFFLSGEKFASCSNKSFEYILIKDNLTYPSSEKKYYFGGKKLEKTTSECRIYKTYFYSDMSYIGNQGDLYVFKIKDSPALDDMKGLSGSPVFDEDKEFVGIAVRYCAEYNTLLVYPAENMLYYLENLV